MGQPDPSLGWQQAQQFLSDNPDLELIEVLLTDLNGTQRGKWIEPHKLDKLFQWDFKMPLSAVMPDIWGRDIEPLCDRTGDADGLIKPVVSTLKREPWLARPTAQMMMSMVQQRGSPWGCDPRVVLEQVLARYQERGWTPVMAPELEFYLFQSQRGEQGQPLLPGTSLHGDCQIGGQVYSTEMLQDSAELLHEIRQSCNEMGLPLDGLVKELSAGQFELNMFHQQNPLKVADDVQTLKRLIKGVARKHDRTASFIAKPAAELAGNGMHVHVSLLDADGNNLFDDGTDQGSDLLRHAVAGLAQTLPDSILLLAPHLNSYRRMGGVHTPKVASWGYENRNASLRIPNGAAAARRIEYRLAGADSNIYLLLATMLAGVLYGIDNQLQPEAPSQDFESSQNSKINLPTNWYSALEQFERSEFMREYLGRDFTEAYAIIKQREQEEFRQHISKLEYETYLALV
ncbi:glutamine synthetase [Motiliproteus coralliicola]|uniref:Glutamine synthetase n=1 Tax=Motiliproteus coralliicola TaxID=2283196 RepID=A0A369WXJ6_9GAMM|nr:glutamine synthetase family protein [Motiliproteus coralliicola]RDE25256.1 glutamine synthetase [Motiliproteus coralliicola]